MRPRRRSAGVGPVRRRDTADEYIVSLFAASESTGGRAEDTLQGCRIERGDGWKAIENSLPRTDCLVVVLPRLGGATHQSRFSRVVDLHPLVPTVLVTRRRAENVRRVRHVRIDEIVWLRSMEASLPRAVDRASTHALFERIAASIERNDTLPPVVRRAVAAVCRGPDPVPSVETLANAVGCDRRTLWYHWRQSLPDRLTLKRVLDWLRLLRAVGRKSRGRSWAAVANEMGVHPKTLARTAVRLTGTTLSRAAAESRAELREDFLAEARPLLSEAPA